MTMDDLDAMADLLGDDEVMRFYPRPKSRAEAQTWIEWTLGNYARDGFGLWVIEDRDGEFLGDCGLTWQTIDGETSWRSATTSYPPAREKASRPTVRVPAATSPEHAESSA